MAIYHSYREILDKTGAFERPRITGLATRSLTAGRWEKKAARLIALSGYYSRAHELYTEETVLMIAQRKKQWLLNQPGL
jgi:hypothetical protein